MGLTEAYKRIYESFYKKDNFLKKNTTPEFFSNKSYN